MKRVVFLSHGADVAGCGIAMKRAFDAHGNGWSARQVCRRRSPYEYPMDILWWWRLPRFVDITKEVRALVAAADVVHVMEDPEFFEAFGDLSGKRLVVHHLGTFYRRDPAGISAKCQAVGAVEVADMHELLYEPHVRWLPTPQDLDGLMRLRRRYYRPGRPLRIAHAPTNREVKGTDIIVDAVARLSRRYRFDFDLIEHVPNRACLARKAQADILVDALSLGYAVNAVESMAMGVPVIGGFDYWTLRQPPADLRERMLADVGALPFVEATPDTIEPVLESLIASPVLRAEWGARGRAHAARFHSAAACVERAVAIYEQAAVEVAA